MSQRDYVAMQARFNGWRYRDPGDVIWSHLFERYRRGDRSVFVRYDNRGVIRSATLIESGYPRAEIARGDRRKDWQVSRWFAAK